jgi:hypothetical protein
MSASGPVESASIPPVQHLPTAQSRSVGAARRLLQENLASTSREEAVECEVASWAASVYVARSCQQRSPSRIAASTVRRPLARTHDGAHSAAVKPIIQMGVQPIILHRCNSTPRANVKRFAPSKKKRPGLQRGVGGRPMPPARRPDRDLASRYRCLDRLTEYGSANRLRFDDHEVRGEHCNICLFLTDCERSADGETGLQDAPFSTMEPVDTSTSTAHRTPPKLRKWTMIWSPKSGLTTKQSRRDRGRQSRLTRCYPTYCRARSECLTDHRSAS